LQLVGKKWRLNTKCKTSVSQNHRIAESQNHRIVGVARDLCGSSSPTPLPKQGHLQQQAVGVSVTPVETSWISCK